MINRLVLEDEKSFVSLGNDIHANFSKLYHLESILHNSFHYLYGYYMEGELVGFIHLIQSFETVDLISIVVDKKFRNKGIASALLNYVFFNIKGMKSILLEVRKSNIEAINLYKKHGFKKIYIRKNYYGNEDAIIMEKVF